MLTKPVDFACSLGHCARCHHDHDEIEWYKFERPIVDEDGTKWTHWGICPITGDPILNRIERIGAPA